MTTIPNLNVVIQQGDAAKESQNIRNNSLESSQLAANERLEEENKKRTIIREAEETERLTLNQEKNKEGKKNPFNKKSRKKTTAEKDKSEDPDSTGRLLDTVA